jgi:hypothetical protein
VARVFRLIEAVPPPLFPFLVEKALLKLGGEASARTAFASAPSQVSVKNKQSRLLSKIKSFIIKDLFSRERTFKRAMVIVMGDWILTEVCGGCDLETGLRLLVLTLRVVVLPLIRSLLIKTGMFIVVGVEGDLHDESMVSSMFCERRRDPEKLGCSLSCLKSSGLLKKVKKLST